MSNRTLAQRLADPTFFAEAARLTVEIRDESDAVDVCLTLARLGQLFGAESTAFASFIRDDEAYDSYRAVLACDPLWCDEYETTAGYMDDPWLEHARHSSEARLTQSIGARTARQRDVLTLAARYGFESGVVVPLHGPQGLSRLGALCMGSSRPAYFGEAELEATAYAARGFAERLYRWQLTQLRNELLSHSQLTDEDVSLLEHERRGRTSKEVAKLIGASAPSVNSRWQRLNAKLGVSSRAEAARLAAEYGVI